MKNPQSKAGFSSSANGKVLHAFLRLLQNQSGDCKIDKADVIVHQAC